MPSAVLRTDARRRFECAIARATLIGAQAEVATGLQVLVWIGKR